MRVVGILSISDRAKWSACEVALWRTLDFSAPIVRFFVSLAKLNPPNPSQGIQLAV